MSERSEPPHSSRPVDKADYMKRFGWEDDQFQYTPPESGDSASDRSRLHRALDFVLDRLRLSK